ncbi:hypothetical protein BDF22DRAFT_740069 [Syncephalis plumigaleata]|nr:hypothetical protein BDF22DRAFT_740069 [Syncephalis plumigaleata]
MLFADFTQAAVTTMRLQGDGHSSSNVINSHRRAISVSKPLQHMKAFWKRHIQKPASDGTGQLLRKTKSSSLFRSSVIFMSDIVSPLSAEGQFFASNKRQTCKDDELDLPYERLATFDTDDIKKRDYVDVLGIMNDTNKQSDLLDNPRKHRPSSMPSSCSEINPTMLQSILETKGILEMSTALQLTQYAQLDDCKYQPRPFSILSIHPQHTELNNAYQSSQLLSL